MSRISLYVFHDCINLCHRSYWQGKWRQLIHSVGAAMFFSIGGTWRKAGGAGNNVTKWQSFYNVMAPNQARHAPTATRTKILENMSQKKKPKFKSPHGGTCSSFPLAATACSACSQSEHLFLGLVWFGLRRQESLCLNLLTLGPV